MAITIPQIMPATTMTTAARKLRIEAFIGNLPPLICCPSIESASSRSRTFARPRHVRRAKKCAACGSALERLVNYIELGQQNDALLLVGIGAGNHGDAAFG